MSVNKQRQRGASLVEFALTIAIFLFVVFGTMELALTYFAWNRVSEAARDGARYLIVNAPLVDLSGQSCSAGAAPVTVSCSGGSCAGLLTRMQTQAPFLTASNLAAQYSCSAAGNPAAPDADRVRTVTLTVSGVANPQIITALTGLGWAGVGTLPTVSVTRTGEDLYTPAP